MSLESTTAEVQRGSGSGSMPPPILAGPPRSVFALETLEILCMGMLWTSLPILLESDSQPQRYGIVTGVASAIGLSTGAVFACQCSSRRADVVASF